jgi:hypothetical protein
VLIEVLLDGSLEFGNTWAQKSALAWLSLFRRRAPPAPRVDGERPIHAPWVTSLTSTLPRVAWL